MPTAESVAGKTLLSPTDHTLILVDFQPPLASDGNQQGAVSRPASPPRAAERVVDYAAGYALVAVTAAAKTECQLR